MAAKRRAKTGKEQDKVQERRLFKANGSFRRIFSLSIL